jgi:hypothetical protein
MHRLASILLLFGIVGYFGANGMALLGMMNEETVFFLIYPGVFNV